MAGLAENLNGQAEGGENTRIDARLMRNLAEQMIHEAGTLDGISAETLETAQGLSAQDKERLGKELTTVATGDTTFARQAVANVAMRTQHSISPATGEAYTGDEIRAYHQPTTQDPNKLQDPGFIEILAQTADTARTEAADGAYSRADATAIVNGALAEVNQRAAELRTEVVPGIMQQVYAQAPEQAPAVGPDTEIRGVVPVAPAAPGG